VGRGGQQELEGLSSTTTAAATTSYNSKNNKAGCEVPLLQALKTSCSPGFEEEEEETERRAVRERLQSRPCWILATGGKGSSACGITNPPGADSVQNSQKVAFFQALPIRSRDQG